MSFLNCACGSSRFEESPERSIRSPPTTDKHYTRITQDNTAMQAEASNKGTEFLPNLGDYQVFTVMGSGCNETATISLGKHTPSGTPVAIRKVHLEKCEMELGMLRHEILMQRQLHHENLLPLLCSFVHENDLWTVTPLMGYGSCKDLLHAHFVEGLPELAIAAILRDVLAGLDYLHTRGIIHRSVRASHILISDNAHICLAGLRHSYSMLDAGQRARAVFDFPEHYIRSLLWASPELLEQNLAGYDTKTDIYSVGITACELANGVVPFADIPATQMLLEKLEGTQPRLLDSITIPELHYDQDATNPQASASDGPTPAKPAPYQRTFSQHFHHFVEVCLHSDPGSRPSAATLSQHNFFRQLKKKSVSELLPELLQPVSPIKDLSNLPAEEVEAAGGDLAEDLQAVSLEDNSWEF